ncbi:hypothetical protein Bca4012_065978 [Brassica carinata]
MKDSVGARLRSFTPEQKMKLKGSYDFVGINYFTSAFVAHVDNVDQEKPSWKFSLQITFTKSRWVQDWFPAGYCQISSVC